MTEAPDTTTEIIETGPSPAQMPAMDPILMPLMLPFMLFQQLSLALMQMSFTPMMQPTMQTTGGQAQQTIVKLGYDKDGNITSVYERRW